jgi:hypothetical protein
MKKDLTEPCCDEGRLGGLSLVICTNADFSIGLSCVLLPQC